MHSRFEGVALHDPSRAVEDMAPSRQGKPLLQEGLNYKSNEIALLRRITAEESEGGLGQ